MAAGSARTLVLPRDAIVKQVAVDPACPAGFYRAPARVTCLATGPCVKECR